MDLVVQVEKQPSPGDTVLGSDLMTFSGGKGANQAVAAAKAGGLVKMLGKVGSDAYGKELIANLVKNKVDTALVVTELGSSGIALITVDSKGENMIVVSSGANRKLQENDIYEEVFKDISYLLLQLEVPLLTVEMAAGLAKKANVKTILNAAPAQKLPNSLINNLDYLVVNEGEAEMISGKKVKTKTDAKLAASILQEMGAKNVIVTLGSEGLVWRSENDAGDLAAHKVEVVDTTAAGDCFCGALSVSLSEGSQLSEAVRFANAAAALATTKEGAQSSLPERSEILKILS